jgi:hypothetical protein
MCLFSTICGVKVEFILRCKVYFEGGEGKLVRAIILYREWYWLMEEGIKYDILLHLFGNELNSYVWFFKFFSVILLAN